LSVTVDEPRKTSSKERKTPMIEWTASDDDGLTYTGLTVAHVYKIALLGPETTRCELRVRDRARLVGVPLDEQFRLLGEYKNPAVAMAYADREEETGR
jgi:hypothetical protein